MKIQRRRVLTKVDGTSRTKQAFKEECDINNIIKKYYKTGQIAHVNNIKGNYGDFTKVSDYHAALNAVMDAQEKFYGLSSKVRAQFDNDPGKLIEFISDDKNYDAAINLGLLDQDKVAAYEQSKKPKDPPPSPA